MVSPTSHLDFVTDDRVSLSPCTLLSYSLPAEHVLARHGHNHFFSCLKKKKKTKTTFQASKLLFYILGPCKLLSIFKESIMQKMKNHCINIASKFMEG